MEPVVSVCCAAYQHAPYIGQALDSFLSQEADFPIEILVHDDASTDGTGRILRDYAARWPNVVKPLFETENQYSRGVAIDPTFNYPRARGEFIALCEGDDYWTDTHKLALQVDYMRAHPECTFLFSNGHVLCDGVTRPFLPWPGQECPVDFTRDQALTLGDMCGVNFAPTASFLFRRSALDALPPEYWQKPCPHGDLKLRLYLTAAGMGAFLHAKTCVYRRNVQTGAMSRWERESGEPVSRRAAGVADMLADVDAFSGGRYHEQVSRFRDWYLYVMLWNAASREPLRDADALRVYRALPLAKRLKYQLKHLPGLGRNAYENQRHP